MKMTSVETLRLSDFISVEAVQERDTDLLLLEELKCNRNFTNWILTRTIGCPDKYDFIGAWHSLSQVGLGESDLVFKIKTRTQQILFLLENKIDACFQPDQAGRYRQRGQKRKDKGECDTFHTVLLAPKKYIVRNNEFDFYIEYEEIKKWFYQQTDLGDRGQYKANILEIAIEKLRRGRTTIVDERATRFWWSYYQYANENYPHLKMRKPPAGIPKLSSFIIFRPSDIGLDKGDQIMHKGYGVVDLQLAGKGDQITNLITKYINRLTDEMEIVQAGKSASIRITIEKVEVTKGFKDQLGMIKTALEKADILYHWAKENLTSKK